MAQLEERAARIEGTLEQMHARLSTVEQDLRNFRSETIQEFKATRGEFVAVLERLESRLEQQFDRIDTHFQQFEAKMETRFQQVDAHFQQVEAKMEMRFQQVDAHFQRVDTRFQQVDARFQQVDAHFQQLETKFDDRLQQMAVQNATQFNRIDQRLDVLHQRLDQKAGTWLVLFWGAWVTACIGVATWLIRLWLP